MRFSVRGTSSVSKKADVHWVETLTTQGLPKADAQAQSIAAHIFAEMLGMICHPEYYKLSEQKVLPFNNTR
jgi:hypothetical protein